MERVSRAYCTTVRSSTSSTSSGSVAAPCSGSTTSAAFGVAHTAAIRTLSASSRKRGNLTCIVYKEVVVDRSM